MRPSYRNIADLFGVDHPEEGESSSIGASNPNATPREKGAALVAEGSYEAAIEQFKKAIEESGGTQTDEMVDLGGAYEMLDFEPQALRQYRKALQVEDHPEPRVAIAELYKRSGKWKEAVAEIERILEVSPADPHANYKLAEMLAESGYLERAIGAAVRAVASSPADPFYHAFLAEIFLKKRLNIEALDAFQAAIELSPGDDFLYIRASVAFWREGKRAEAAKAVRLASDLDPERLLYYGYLAELLMRSDMLEEAALEAKKAAKMDQYDREQLRRLLAELA